MTAIVDADLIGRKKHRFPNLACMKISGWYKRSGETVELKTDYANLEKYDRIFLSKVFTDTPVPREVLHLPTVQYGGTGFFYDRAQKLPEEIEHSFPDYHLYDDWVKEQRKSGTSTRELRYYTDFSIGFLTRGCFRQCEFCVNRNYKRVCEHSPLSEFYDETRPMICLLDDNFFGWPNWREALTLLQQTGKPFQFKQGLDERLLTDEKCDLLFRSKYVGDFIFAFDNIADREVIEEKLRMVRRHTERQLMFYVFCGFDRGDKWDVVFWKQDLRDLWERIAILMRYRALPYIMRFERYKESPYAVLYNQIARWCNQPAFFKKKAFREFCAIRKGGAGWTNMLLAELDMPELTPYFDMKWSLQT